MVIGLMALLIVVSGRPAVADGSVTEVVGTGDPAIDVPAVQAAVDTAGTILLKGTFDFGDWGTVAVTGDDVEIRGERTGGVYHTRIMGGQIPFLVGSSATGPWEFLDPDAITPVNDFSIEAIYFENAMIAIGVMACHGEVTIAGNEIVDGRPLDFGGLPVAVGIYVGPTPGGYDPAVVTADVTIRNNRIDGRARSWPEPAPDPWAVCGPHTGRCYRGLSMGIYFAYADAHAKIVRNEVVDVFQNGISLENSWPESHSEEMSATVSRNTVVPSATEFRGNGLTAWSVKAHIAGNTVDVANPESLGGVVCGSCYDSVIRGNRVSYSNGWLGAISLVVDDWSNMRVTRNRVIRNRITGEAPFAIALTPAALGGTAPAETNTIIENEVKRFTPAPTVWGFAAHYVLMEGANKNLIVGRHGDVIDWGEDNTIIGLTKKLGNMGLTLKEAPEHRGAR
jgi:hypothetical protein